MKKREEERETERQTVSERKSSFENRGVVGESDVKIEHLSKDGRLRSVQAVGRTETKVSSLRLEDSNASRMRPTH